MRENTAWLCRGDRRWGHRAASGHILKGEPTVSADGADVGRKALPLTQEARGQHLLR